MHVKYRTRMYRLTWPCLVVVLALFAEFAVAADEISRSEPRVYRNTLSRFLTPIEDLLDKPVAGVDADTNIVAVLRENMHYVEGDGKIWKLRHNAFRANNEAGVEVLKEQTVHFRRTDQRIYLLMARTILPDGRKVAVEDRAAFIKTPQYQADISLYTDNAELTIVFPSVVKGAVIEYIAMVEDRKPVIGDDAYVSQFYFDNYWPTVHAHHVVDLPTKLADKLQIHTLGDIPEATREKAGWRRSRLQWTKSGMPALHWEPNHPSLSITGPALKLTTFADWDAFAGWYRGLLKKPSKLPRALELELDEWTDGVTEPLQVLELLLQKVSVGVRYTGLEFGIGGYQPRNCADIWDTQYGDCKDKSNLLRVMLARKGIDAHLALLNTEGRGQLDRQAPSHGQFNHVILAVVLGGQYVFCDPTIPYLKPGQLDSGDLDRDLLLIKPDGHEFVRTPQQRLGTLNVKFELKYEPDSRLSGWMTLSATDVWAARYADHFWDMDRRATRASLHNSLQGFYPGAELIDYESVNADDWNGEFRIRAYFIVAGSNDTNHGAGSLRFPEGGYALPKLGDVRTRSIVFPQSMDTVKLSVQYRLPPGWSASATPSPYEVKSESLEASAAWTIEGNHCRAELSCNKLQAVVSPSEYSVLFNAVAGLKAWVERTLPIKQGAEAPTPDKSGGLEGFDAMPTADGQMALLYARFPEDGSIALRRQALNKVLQLFPNDRGTGFTARVELARLLQREEKWAESERMVVQLLEQYANDIDQEALSWGEYLVATAALKLDRRDEAITQLESIAQNPANIPFRRSWAYFDAAQALVEDEPERAMKLLWDGLEFHSPIYRYIVRRQAQLLLERDQVDALPRLAALLDKSENRGAEAAVATLLDLVQWLLGSDEPAHGKALWEALLPLRDAAHLGALSEKFDTTESAVANSAQHVLVKDALRALFEQRAPNWWADIEVDESWDGPQVDKQLMMAVLRDDLRRYIRLQVESLLRFPQTADHFSERLWRVLSRLPGSELEPELLPEILGICDMLPADDQVRIESQFIKGEWLSDKGEIEGARKVYEKAMAENDSPSFTAVGHLRLGLLAARESKSKGARAHFARGAKLLDDAGEPAISCTVQGIYLDLATGNHTGAIAGIDSLVALDEEMRKDVEAAARIQELITLATVPDMARRYWSSHSTWWPLWTTLAAQLKLRASAAGDPLPDPDTLRDMIARAVRSGDRKAAGDALTA
ncbi:MAG: tetratricopeptide (TPR) repeat protein, partial [Rhodothermales bacterium]